MKFVISSKQVLGFFALIAWIAGFIQLFNSLWAFWNFPIQSIVGDWGNSIGSAFNWSVWAWSGFLTIIVSVLLTAWWLCTREDS